MQKHLKFLIISLFVIFSLSILSAKALKKSVGQTPLTPQEPEIIPKNTTNGECLK